MALASVGAGRGSRGEQEATREMPHIAVVTDSSVCLPAGLVQELGIRILPITVHLPGADRPDGGEDLPLLVYEALEADQPVKSSPPSVAEYLAAIEEAEADAVVVVTPAALYTAMGANAALAASLATRQAVVVDSGTGAAGQGLVALAGAVRAAEGGRLEAVVDAAEEAAGRVDLVGALAALTPLRRSGRVPSAVLDGRGREQVRSVFRMRGGAIEPLDSVRSPGAALDRIRGEWESGGGPASSSAIVFHGDAAGLAGDLRARLGTQTLTADFSAAMGIYTGRGVVGVAWLPAG